MFFVPDDPDRGGMCFGTIRHWCVVHATVYANAETLPKRADEETARSEFQRGGRTRSLLQISCTTRSPVGAGVGGGSSHTERCMWTCVGTRSNINAKAIENQRARARIARTSHDVCVCVYVCVCTYVYTGLKAEKSSSFHRYSARADRQRRSCRM